MADSSSERATPASSCSFCRRGGATAAFKKCGRCSVALYCDAACQRKHWKAGHKTACRPAAPAKAGATVGGGGAPEPAVQILPPDAAVPAAPLFAGTSAVPAALEVRDTPDVGRAVFVKDATAPFTTCVRERPVVSAAG